MTHDTTMERAGEERRGGPPQKKLKIDDVCIYDHAMYVYHHNSTCCAAYVYAFWHAQRESVINKLKRDICLSYKKASYGNTTAVETL